MLKTRPYLRCYVLIPINISYSPYYNYRIPFPTRPSVIRCFDYRSRRTNALLPPTPTPDIIESEDISFVISRVVNFLLREYSSRVVTSSLFPPEISSLYIRLSVARFKKGIALASRDITYSLYGTLIPSTNNLYSGYYTALLRGSTLKFSAKNKINITLY
ncbi:hypothetical protein N7467_001573 [Penicillium canescens]|nr:hypothetical protein N7467_001573 [Penicillium canescens]